MTVPVSKYPKGRKPKIALALGGGAARGWAHIGVIRALKEMEIEPEIVVGTSIGAVVGGCFVAKKLDELEEFARGLSLSRILSCLDLTFSGSGLMSGRKIKNVLNRHLQNISIEQLKRRFIAVATELGTGQEVWLSKGRLVNAMHASFAIPGVFNPVDIRGRLFMDGACVNPVPVSVCKEMGADIIIAVTLNASHQQTNLPAPINHQDEKPPLKRPVGAAQTAHRQLNETLHVMPNVFNVMQEAINATLDTITQTRLTYEKPDIILSPEVGEIGMFDFHRAEEAIASGYQVTKKQITKIDFEKADEDIREIAA